MVPFYIPDSLWFVSGWLCAGMLYARRSVYMTAHTSSTVGISDSVMQGLNEAVEYQQGRGQAKTAKLTAKPVSRFNAQEIRGIRQSAGMSQVMLAGLLGVSLKTVEAWKNGRNQPEGPSCRLLEIVRDDPQFLLRFQQEA